MDNQSLKPGDWVRIPGGIDAWTLIEYSTPERVLVERYYDKARYTFDANRIERLPNHLRPQVKSSIRPS